MDKSGRPEGGESIPTKEQAVEKAINEIPKEVPSQPVEVPAQNEAELPQVTQEEEKKDQPQEEMAKEVPIATPAGEIEAEDIEQVPGSVKAAQAINNRIGQGEQT